MTVMGAQLFFWGRVAFAVVYLVGYPLGADCHLGCRHDRFGPHLPAVDLKAAITGAP